MPSLRKRVSTYFRQLSFHNDTSIRKRNNLHENSFVNKYLQGQITLKEGPPILYGKTPTDLPNYDLGHYQSGPETVVGCYSGPGGGLTTVRRVEKHLSVHDADIDFIDTPPHQDSAATVTVTTTKIHRHPVDNTTMVIKVAGQEYRVTNNKQKRNSKSHSLDDLTTAAAAAATATATENNNCEEVKCRNSSGVVETETRNRNECCDQNYALAKSKSEGNPFEHKKRGKIKRLAQRPAAMADGATGNASLAPTNTLPTEWSRKSDHIYGLSDSLYDRNQVTKNRNGEPIADCFGIITRRDSAILAVADGVNWGEKACLAAKSAVHGCLHYLNKTIFCDTKAFDALVVKAGGGGSEGNVSQDSASLSGGDQRILNTREVFVCLLRAFNCAHDLILENKGMLTTLTVAVVLPLKPRHVVKKTESGEEEYRKCDRDRQFLHEGQRSPGGGGRSEDRYVCCVCNVGDTLAYVYSQKYGVRELTKGSHDINCNRDMRDALGALGPVDGINPELSNLTLSITTLQKGDIVFVASDGLTDNFDPNVCKFTVNCSLPEPPQKTKRAPIKPPRKPKSPETDNNNPLVAEFLKENALEPTKPPETRMRSHQKPTQASLNRSAQLLRSKTTLDMRSPKQIPRNADGIPFVTPLQRYELTLLLMEDILKRGISGKEAQCVTAKRLCENLVNFTFSITAAKRRTLEDADLYFDSRNGVLVEVSGQEKKLRRKRGLERVQNLPGKLDHVSVVACNVGGL